MYYVYAISSSNHQYIYVGLSSNLLSRFRRHNRGFELTTKPYRPFDLLFVELVSNRQLARKREKYWKSGIGKQQLKQMRNKLQRHVLL